jgi:eukaryotic-like serine/threonine-protein kinase
MSPFAAIDLAWLKQQFPDLSNLTPLNSGGQKQVFSADHATDGAVVLKIIHPHQHLELTRREAVAAGQLSAHRVPQILDAALLGTPLGQCVWFRERRVQGESVRDMVQRGPFDKVPLLKLGLQTLEILVAAEGIRIVHRDIKPDNLICDTQGNYWLIDFGLARHLDLTSLTATANAFGKHTPGYAPPEQFRNRKLEIDVRCDLFGLGVTLYEAATGTNPYTAGARDVLEVIQRIQGPPLPPLVLNFPSARNFGDLVSALTQPRRDHRPASAQEAFEWMKNICDAEGI